MPHATEQISKSPAEWTTGSEPMTARQRWFLNDPCQKANVPLDEKLSKAEASKEIERLKVMASRRSAPETATPVRSS